MLTRLKVSGFKNLIDVDIYFGAFTCIIGQNGVGKSNIFDAIRFLSALADRSLVEAAHLVRGEDGARADIRGLFHKVGDQYSQTMRFEVEMIIPREGVDDFNQSAVAKGTFLRYIVEIGWSDDSDHAQPLELLEEELQYVTLEKSAIENNLPFHHERSWSESIKKQEKRGRNAPFISTDRARRVINLHYDGKSGKPFPRDARKLPRTVLSAVTAAESPTGVLARSEMRSWQLFQLEPSAMRKPDEFSTPPYLGANGANLAAALYRLAKNDSSIYQQVANQLSDLLDDIKAVKIDSDEKRETLTLMVQGRDGTWHPAQALSDGTLRFLALTVKSLDPETSGVICLEEPENGIHPARIPAMLKLLKKIATDTSEPVDDTNPLRQVIINTHAPGVMRIVDDDSLLFADLRERHDQRGFYKSLHFFCLPDTWRSNDPVNMQVMNRGEILPYITPAPLDPFENNGSNRVIDTPFVKLMLLFLKETS
jgi:predicted ATPase